MKLGARIFFCYLLIFCACFYYPIDWTLGTLRIRYLEGVEDPLVDQANILAAVVGNEMERGVFHPGNLAQIFRDVYSRSLQADIYNFKKTSVDIRVYITDQAGLVVFDSENKANMGRDFSKWRDVRLTLDGKYGARTTQRNKAEPTSSVLYVAAPIRVHGEPAGVLTVAKPTTNINNFLSSAKPRISMKGAVSLLIAAVLSLLASVWLTRPIKRLTQYAHSIREGRRADFPKLDRSEIGEMGEALRKMQEALEGKRYIEEYVQTLTHELKSPLSAIRGAAELLEEDMEPAQRDRFLSNIRNETNRIQNLVERLLELAYLENLKMLPKQEKISLGAMLNTVVESKQPLLTRKEINLTIQMEADINLKGDPFLLHQAIANILQNAVDFSPQQGRIVICMQPDGNRIVIQVDDQGPGIPDYAVEKVFEKFFSLERPGTGKKSTGLGLNFVREVMHLHQGEVLLQKQSQGGLRATLILPNDQ